MQTKITRFFFIGLLFLAINHTSAQSSFKLDPKTSTYIDKSVMECIYKYTVNAPLKDSLNKRRLITYTTILQANSTVSKFWDWNSFKKDSIVYFSPIEINSDSVRKLKWKYYFKVKNLFTPVVFKNYPTDKNTITDEILSTDYIYSENRVNPHWTIIDDTLTVCGYLCNKAVTVFGGLKWTVWYAPEITLSDGPWKLCGLPGLILKAFDSTATHSFEAIAVRNSDRPIYFEKNVTQFKVEKNKYLKEKKNFESAETKDIMDVSFLKSNEERTIWLEERRLVVNRKTVYCPLELE